MKRENLKIFSISFVLVYAMIAGLCIINKQPLIFADGYSFSQFFALFILLGFLSFALIFVMESLEKILKKFLFPKLTSSFSIYAYFIIISILGLFAFTLFAGFVESGISPFLYYRCFTNSCLYLFSGYAVTFLIAVYFAYRFIKSSLAQAKL
jgi:hypothetical protein